MTWYLTFSAIAAGLLLLAATIAVPAPNDIIVKNDRSSVTPASSPNGEKVPSTIPLSASQLDGWRGVRLAGVFDNKRFYCLAEFPEKFGLRDKREMDLLLLLIRHDPSFKFDVKCYVDSSGVALGHLFRLATDYQDTGTARWFVMPNGLALLNLDGELAEQYVLEYRPKVLMKFRNLRRIAPVEEESILAEEICAVVMTSADAYLDGVGMKPVIDSLRRKGMGSLADRIAKECGAP